MAELLYWITLDCTGVPNEMASKCKKDKKLEI